MEDPWGSQTLTKPCKTDATSLSNVKTGKTRGFHQLVCLGDAATCKFNGENIVDIDHQHNSKSLDINPARTFSEAQTFCKPALLLSVVCVHLPQCPLVPRAKIDEDWLLFVDANPTLHM